MSATHINPQTTALLLLHFQYGTLSAGQSLPLAGEAAVFADRLREAGVTVVFVNVGFTEAQAAAVPQTHPMLYGLASAGMMRVGSDEGANVGPLQPAAEDLTVLSPRFGAFSTTDLDAQLRALGIGTVILAGVATGAVVIDCALEASDRDYEVIVAEDLTADPDPAVQASVLGGMIPRIGRVSDTSKILAGAEVYPDSTAS